MASQTQQVKVFQSSHIQQAQYDPDARALLITYTNGRTYQNSPTAPVPAGLWDAFVKSGSPGQFFDQEIKPMWAGYEIENTKEKVR